MKLDTTNWKEFQLTEVFILKGGFYNKKPEHSIDGRVPFLASTESNNGVTEYYSLQDIQMWDKVGNIDNTLDKKIYKGNCITVTVNGSVCNAFYQSSDFTCSHDITALYPINHELTVAQALFICTVIMKEKYRWSYGRKPHDVRKFGRSIIKLPVTQEGIVDWEFMEQYIKSLNHKPLTTANSGSGLPTLAVDSWKSFKVCDLFEVRYGINMELNACIEAEETDETAINFVARTESNNGVSARVKLIEGKEPQPAGLITCAGGGSVLSTFLQKEPFYSGRDLYLLIPRNPMSKEAKLFCITVIKANKYRYSYGRQANVTLPHLELMLPVDAYGNPDFVFMENYIKSLPYGDRI